MARVAVGVVGTFAVNPVVASAVTNGIPVTAALALDVNEQLVALIPSLYRK
jgi:hypothetical protein